MGKRVFTYYFFVVSEAVIAFFIPVTVISPILRIIFILAEFLLKLVDKRRLFYLKQMFIPEHFQSFIQIFSLLEFIDVFFFSNSHDEFHELVPVNSSFYVSWISTAYDSFTEKKKEKPYRAPESTVIMFKAFMCFVEF